MRATRPVERGVDKTAAPLSKSGYGRGASLSHGRATGGEVDLVSQIRLHVS